MHDEFPPVPRREILGAEPLAEAEKSRKIPAKIERPSLTRSRRDLDAQKSDTNPDFVSSDGELFRLIRNFRFWMTFELR